jgi:hypothetical protein
MFVAEHDKVANDADSRKLAKKLGPQSVIEYSLVNNFDHYSFTMFNSSDKEAEKYLKRMIYWIHQKNPLPHLAQPT